MKLFRRLFNNEVSKIIELTRENDQLKQEVKNLLFVAIYEIQDRGTEREKEWSYGITPLHREHAFDYIVNQIRELLSENKKLKEEIQKSKNPEKQNPDMEIKTGNVTTRITFSMLPELCKNCCNLKVPEACKQCKDPFGFMHNVKLLDQKQ